MSDWATLIAGTQRSCPGRQKPHLAFFPDSGFDLTGDAVGARSALCGLGLEPGGIVGAIAKEGRSMDVSILRLVVVSIGAIGCLCVGGLVICAAMGREPPASLGTIGGMAIGALCGILVPPFRPGHGGPPQQP